MFLWEVLIFVGAIKRLKPSKNSFSGCVNLALVLSHHIITVIMFHLACDVEQLVFGASLESISFSMFCSNYWVVSVYVTFVCQLPRLFDIMAL